MTTEEPVENMPPAWGPEASEAPGPTDRTAQALLLASSKALQEASPLSPGRRPHSSPVCGHLWGTLVPQPGSPAWRSAGTWARWPVCGPACQAAPSTPGELLRHQLHSCHPGPTSRRVLLLMTFEGKRVFRRVWGLSVELSISCFS